MAEKPLEIAGKLKSTTKGATDWYFGGGNEAWNSTADAIAGVPETIRSGKTVGVIENGKIIKYIWHPNNITDGGLVLESSVNATSNLAPQGNWDASTNTPDISSESNTGYYWIVSVAGTTNIDGITEWNVNDWVVKTDGGWAKIDNTDKVISVAGKSGNVVLNYTDITNFNIGVNSVVNGVYALISQLFSGSYNDLTDKPNLSQYALISQLFSGSYNDLTNTPDISKLLTGTDDSLFIDEDKILRQNIVTFYDEYKYNKSTPNLPLSFDTIEILYVIHKGNILEKSEYIYEDVNTLRILKTIANGDYLRVSYRHFVDAVYNSNRANYVNGTTTNIISCVDSMDVVFLVDFTGSMGSTINTVKNNILTILNTIETESNNDFRISIVLFDECINTSTPSYDSVATYTTLPSSQKLVKSGTGNTNIYITNFISFSSNKTTIETEIAKLNTTDFPLGSGVNSPEPSDVALSEIIENNFAGTFRTSANKSIILFTDASAGGLDDANSELDTTELNRLKTILINKGIVFSTMFNSTTINVDYQEITEATQGKYVSDFTSVSEITTAIEEICNNI